MGLFSSQLSKVYYFKKQYVRVCNWTKDPQGIIEYLALTGQKNSFQHILIIHRMTFKYEYIGEFEFILENNLGYASGDHVRAFDGKAEVESLVQPLRETEICQCSASGESVVVSYQRRHNTPSVSTDSSKSA